MDDGATDPCDAITVEEIGSDNRLVSTRWRSW
jgi:hypothetical protein